MGSAQLKFEFDSSKDEKRVPVSNLVAGDTFSFGNDAYIYMMCHNRVIVNVIPTPGEFLRNDVDRQSSVIPMDCTLHVNGPVR